MRLLISCNLQRKSHVSRATAYLYILRHYHNKKVHVGNHLLISLPNYHFRLNEARKTGRTQYMHSDSMGKLGSAFFPGSWCSSNSANRTDYLAAPTWIQMEIRAIRDSTNTLSAPGTKKGQSGGRLHRHLGRIALPAWYDATEQFTRDGCSPCRIDSRIFFPSLGA